MSTNSPTERVVVNCVIPYGIYGGAEVYLKDLVKSSRRDGLFFNFLMFGDNRIRMFFEDDPFVSFRIFGNPEDMKKWIMNHQSDVFLFYNRKDIYDMVQEMKSNGLRSKVIEIYHSDFKWKGSMSTLEERIGIDTMIITYPELGMNISGIFERRVVPIPVDTERFHRTPFSLKNIKNPFGNEKKTIGIVARLSKEKNIDYVLDTAKIMKDFNFIIVGDGPESDRLLSRIKSEGLTNTKLLGHQDDTSSYYLMMDAFLMASDLEGTSISILEAMSSNVLVFSNLVGGISSILEDNHTGIRIYGNPEEDSKIIRTNINRANLTNNARSFVIKNHGVSECSNLFKNAIVGDIDSFKRNNERDLDGEVVIMGDFV